MKKYKKWGPPVVSYVPPIPKPSQFPGMRMEMRPLGGMYDQQKQIMKLSPRVRDKPLTKAKRAKLFKFRGRKTSKE